jgi:murein L,D-transpeptidase YcbB/YkuD
VPRSIMTRELLPQLQRDPGRLSKDRLRLFAGSGPDAMEVDPRTVDWSKVTPASWRYRIRQDAGPGNALGVIKFMFPNADDIYLHDTPTKYLFNRSVRTFSHGCIRVEDPLALADVLLAGQGWPRSRLEKVIEAGLPERFVRLQTEVPIHLAYITAWVGKSGRLQFLDDVYGRDALLQQALGTRNS